MDKKLCPIFTLGAMAGNYDHDEYTCKREDCAWWTTDKGCAVLDIAETLICFRVNGMPVNNCF